MSLPCPVRLPSLSLACLLLASASGKPTPPDEVVFNRDIRPLLSNTCFACHGPDTKNNTSSLRLDLREQATAAHRTKDGRMVTAIVAGNPSASEIWRRINSQNKTEVMPPPDSLRQLTDRDRALIKRWIEQGANYQPHWSYLPPVRGTPPAVKTATWARNPIDSFVLGKLESASLAPAREAERPTLVRRLTLDLTGLPPTPAEVDAFVQDSSPQAYERLVDRLLASPHYGERMAVPWLDAVRFADSVGFHGDQRLNNFPYRDYVIDAFNSNLPYDRFVREQLAGDLLPAPTPAQLIATGFNRLNLVTREGGAQNKEYLAKSAADRVRAVSSAFLGSTMACAECHDHKYDPFTTRDFYAMAAYFADVKQWGYYGSNMNPELANTTEDHPFPPEIEVDSPYLHRRLDRLQRQRAARLDQAALDLLDSPTAPSTLAAWARRNAAAFTANSDGWLASAVTAAQPGRYTHATTTPEGNVRCTAIDSEKKAPWGEYDRFEVTLSPPPGDYVAVRLEALPDPAAEGNVSRDKSGRFELGLQLAVLRAGETVSRALAISHGMAQQASDTYENGYAQPTFTRPWMSRPQDAQRAQSAHWQLAERVTLAEGDRLVATLATNDVRLVRFSVSPFGLRLPGESVPESLVKSVAALAAANPALSTDQQRELAQACFRSGEPAVAPTYAAALTDVREIAACRDGRTFSTITVATEPRVTRVLPRGNWQDDSGEIVQPAPPAFLAAGAGFGAAGRRATRLDLADWMTDRRNPLTARNFVNRTWRLFFGHGLSAVVDDLGRQGEYPSHPELLDWLAVEFMDSGWDVKRLVRLMVASATYRQDSQRRPELREMDPENRLLAAATPRRLAAEFIRDNALAAAGLLQPEIGGPSVHPYQPDGYYASMNFPKRAYVADPDERQYRRGLYIHWQRTFLHPMLINFDAPSRDECVAARTESNTPLQALTLLNDPTFVEAARALAARMLAESVDASFASRLDRGFRLVLARPAQPVEREGLERFLAAQLETYRATPADAAALLRVGLQPVDSKSDPVELAAWTQIARVLLNLNETLVRY